MTYRWTQLIVAVCFMAILAGRAGWAQRELIKEIGIEDQMGSRSVEGAIPLEPGEVLHIQKVPVVDCRIGRGFSYAPVDGRIDTRWYRDRMGEYPCESWYTAVYYDLNQSNGLHITLADEDGFDALIIRGTFRGAMYRDGRPFIPGDKAKKISDIKCPAYVFRRIFPNRMPLSQVHLYYEGERAQAGRLGDASFLRITRDGQSKTGTGLAVAGAASMPEKIAPWLTGRFGRNARVFALVERGKSRPVQLEGPEFIHFLTPTQDPAQGVSAVTWRGRIEEIAGPTLLTLRVQDPLDPSREIMGVDLLVKQPGVYEVSLDFQDQVFLPADLGKVPLVYGPPLAPPPVLWLSLGANAAATIRGAEFVLHHVPRETAMPQAMAWRRLLIKHQFSTMSEPRRWRVIDPGENIREWLASYSGSRKADFVPGNELLFALIEQARVLDPKDDVVRQYHEWVFQWGRPLRPWSVMLPEEKDLPRWAVLLHEAYLGVRSIPAWWIENRLAEESGEIGTGLNDDGVMMMHWAPFPMIEDAPLGEAMRDMAVKLADMAQKFYLTDGMSRFVHSPHHSYEDGINQRCLNAWWFYGDPVHYERAMASARGMTKFMVDAGCGHRHFYNTKLSPKALEGIKEPGRAGHTHPWLLNPAYEVAWYSKNPAALKFYSQWADAWIEHQKVGNYATLIDVKSGKVVQADKTWVGFGGAGTQGVAWNGIYDITGDPRFLKPYFMACDAGHLKFLEKRPVDFINAPDFMERYRDKIRPKHVRGGRGGTLVERYSDKVAPQHLPGGYSAWRLTGDKKYLGPALEEALTEWQRFGHMYTAAEQFTDRVSLETFEEVFNCYLGSFASRYRFTHNFAVSYEGLGADFAALVGPCNNRSLKVALVNFARKDLVGRMRVWRLDHGRYKVRVGPDANDDGELDRVEKEELMVLRRYSPIALRLPRRRQTLIEVEQVEALDDIRDRADLALSAMDTLLGADGSVKVRVHNIGSKTAGGIEVAHVREGKTLASRTVATLEAPVDLMPRVRVVTFMDVRPGDVIVVDGEDAVPEIAEHNNRLVLRRPEEITLGARVYRGGAYGGLKAYLP